MTETTPRPYYTMTFATLGITLELDDMFQPIGYEKLATVYPSTGSIEAHNCTLKELALQNGLDKIAPLRFRTLKSGVECYAVPALKVWWMQDFA